MRIISQKGICPMLDLPYEHVALMADGRNIYAKIGNENKMLIATYSASEKAMAAMESINKSYPCYVVKGNRTALSSTKCDVFRFPED